MHERLDGSRMSFSTPRRWSVATAPDHRDGSAAWAGAWRRNDFPVWPPSERMVDVGPVFYGMLAALLLFFFFIYLFIRRTLLGFKEGMDEGRQGRG
jgi:hypothetical protein